MGPLSADMAEFDDPDLPLERMFEIWPKTAAVFVELGLLCVGCPVSPFHTVSDTCREYRLDEDAFRERLRGIVRATQEADPTR